MALQFLEKDSYFRLSVEVSENDEVQDYWLRTDELEPNDEYIIEGNDFIDLIKVPTFALVKKDENVFKLAKANLN